MAAATEEVVTTRIESHTAVRRQVVSNQMTIGGVMEKLSRGVNARIELPFSVDLVFPKDARYSKAYCFLSVDLRPLCLPPRESFSTVRQGFSTFFDRDPF